MKILMTTDNIGGVWTYCLDLAGELGRRGVTVELACMGRPISDVQRRQVESLANVRLHASIYKQEWMDQPWPDVDQAGAWLLSLARGTGVNVVHLNNYSHAALDWGRPVLVVGHSDVLSWWQAVKGQPAGRDWDTYRRRVGRGLRSADLVVAPTLAMMETLHEQYGPLGPAWVIANGRRADRFRRRVKQRIVFCAGRLWDEGKNLSSLVAAAEEIDWPVFIGGDGSSREHGRAVSLGWLGPDDMADWLGRSAIYAHPARYEPFGLAPLEAGLSGCALVLGDVPSLREVWGDAAEYADPSNPEDLAAKIRRLTGDREHLREMSRRAHRHALCYAVEPMADRYLQAYRMLTSPRGRTPANRVALQH